MISKVKWIKIRLNYFFNDFDRKKIKVTSSGTSPTGIDKILKMTLAPPGGHDEGVEVKHVVEKTIRDHPLIIVSGEITASLRSALSWDP